MTLQRSIPTLLLVAIVCTGCVTSEGVFVTSDPYIYEEFVKYGQQPDATSDTESGSLDNAVNGVIVVGTVSAYREFKPSDFESEHESYAKSFETWESDRPLHLDLEDFSKTIRGWTRIKLFGLPLVFAGYVKALVPVEGAEDVEFEPAVVTFLFQSGRDLVAARTNSDGAFVIEALLCKDQPGYYQCSKRYKLGLFDSMTGQKLRLNLEGARNGPWIDPITFEVIDPPTDRQSSSDDRTGD